MGAPGFGSDDSAEMNGAGRGLVAVGQGGVGGLLKGKRDPSQALKGEEASQCWASVLSSPSSLCLLRVRPINPRDKVLRQGT